MWRNFHIFNCDLLCINFNVFCLLLLSDKDRCSNKIEAIFRHNCLANGTIELVLRTDPSAISRPMCVQLRTNEITFIRTPFWPAWSKYQFALMTLILRSHVRQCLPGGSTSLHKAPHDFAMYASSVTIAYSNNNICIVTLCPYATAINAVSGLTYMYTNNPAFLSMLLHGYFYAKYADTALLSTRVFANKNGNKNIFYLANKWRIVDDNLFVYLFIYFMYIYAQFFLRI